MKLRYMKNFESKLQAQKIRWNSPKVSPAACENWHQFLLFKTLAHIRFSTNADLLISYQQEHNSYKDRVYTYKRFSQICHVHLSSYDLNKLRKLLKHFLKAKVCAVFLKPKFHPFSKQVSSCRLRFSLQFTLLVKYIQNYFYIFITATAA